jgi:hypothetical protein
LIDGKMIRARASLDVCRRQVQNEPARLEAELRWDHLLHVKRLG